jgi:16S rRNA (guanine1516-N2)-methyltransferase
MSLTMPDSIFINCDNEEKKQLAKAWQDFLVKEKFNFADIQKIDFSTTNPTVFDSSNNKFCIDFANNKTNYHKKKASLKSEIISKAMGAGKHGLKVLDLSAGLGIDAVFLTQLGYEVTALERNPLVFLCLSHALKQNPVKSLNFIYCNAKDYLQNQAEIFNVVYFDPMFPEKTKSALPRQEMVFFKNLVGDDADALEVLQLAIQHVGIKRVAVKRPLKAPALGLKPFASIDGKLIRFDLYGVKAK